MSSAEEAEILALVPRLLGPVVIAVVLNSFAYGICTIEFFQYRLSRYKDPKYLQIMVHWAYFVDTVHTAACMYMLWDYGVTNFLNVTVIESALWPFTATPILTGSSNAVPIQHLFAYRLKKATGSTAVFAALSFLSLASGALGIANAVSGLANPDVSDFSKLIPLADTWLAVTAVCDISMAALLLMHLMRGGTSNLPKSDNFAARLLHVSVETTAFTAIFCIFDLALFTSMDNTNFHIMFALPMGRLYSATLMASLNSRASLREDLADSIAFMNPNFVRAFEIGGVKPTEVTIAVEQDIQMDAYVPHTSGSSAKGRDIADPAGDNYSFTPM